MDCSDEETLHRYLSSLHMEYIAGNYSFSGNERKVTMIYDTPESVLGVTLTHDIIKVTQLYGDRETECYYLPEGVDWELLDACMTVTELK